MDLYEVLDKNKVFGSHFVLSLELKTMESTVMDKSTCISLDEEESSCVTQNSSEKWSSSLFSQTPITFYQDAIEVPGAPPGAPKKCTMYLCHTQIQPSGTLCEDWSLQPWLHGGPLTDHGHMTWLTSGYHVAVM